MIQDLTISYVCNGIETTFTIEDDHYDYDNMPYNLADMFEEVSIESGWIKVRDKHYCEDCHHYGDDNELVLGDGTVIQQDEDDWI